MEYTFKEEQIDEAAALLLKSLANQVICFYGELGAGTTTLITALVRALGGAPRGNSPTFGIVSEYSKEDGSLLGYHFDFYRIEDETEALDLGLEEYLQQDVWIFIEWPEKIENLLPESCVRVEVMVSQETRLIKARK